MKRLSAAAVLCSLSFSAKMAVQYFRSVSLLLIGLVCSTTPAVRFPPATGASLNKTTSKIKS